MPLEGVQLQSQAWVGEGAGHTPDRPCKPGCLRRLQMDSRPGSLHRWCGLPGGDRCPHPSSPAAAGAGRVPRFTSPLGGHPVTPTPPPQEPRKAHSRVALPGQGVALQAGAHGDVGEGVSAAAALDGDAGGLGADPGGGDDDAWDLHQVRHRVRL